MPLIIFLCELGDEHSSVLVREPGHTIWTCSHICQHYAWMEDKIHGIWKWRLPNSVASVFDFNTNFKFATRVLSNLLVGWVRHKKSQKNPKLGWFHWYLILEPEASLYLRLRTPSDSQNTRVMLSYYFKPEEFNNANYVGLIAITSRNWEPQLPTEVMFVRRQINRLGPSIIFGFTQWVFSWAPYWVVHIITSEW